MIFHAEIRREAVYYYYITNKKSSMQKTDDFLFQVAVKKIFRNSGLEI